MLTENRPQAGEFAPLKKSEILRKKDINILGLRNAVYYESWEFMNYWDVYYGEFG